MSAPIEAGSVDAALEGVDGGKTKAKFTGGIVGSYEEYLEQRGYFPWRTITHHTFPTYNPKKFVSWAPFFFYKGNNKPAVPSRSVRGTIVERSVTREVDGEATQVKVKSIEVNGTPAAPGTLVWCNPNRMLDADGMATENFKSPAKASGDRLYYDTCELEMTVYEVVSKEEIIEVEYQLRSNLLLPLPFFLLNYEMRYQKHIYNWGLGSTFRDFCIIWTCFFALWGFTGLLFFVTMAAHLASENSSGALWMFAFMMALGWTFIGIALHARGVVTERDAKNAAEAEEAA